MRTIVVGVKSEPNAVARAIVHSVMIGERTELTAIAAEAKARAVTAIVAANISLAHKGRRISCVPRWEEEAVVDGRRMTATRFALTLHEVPPDNPHPIDKHEPAGD